MLMFKPLAKHEFVLQFSGALCWGLSICCLLFAYAYTQDIAAILASPAQLWAFVCGVPLQRNSTIPILVGIGGAGACFGSMLLFVRGRAILPR
jgi:hypothetical protein